MTAIYDGNYRDALDALDRIDDDRVFDADLGRYLTSKDLLYARTYRLAENRERSLHFFESVERRASQWLAAPPDEDPFTRACWYLTLAEAQVMLGRTDEALESMRAALSLVPKATNAVEGTALQLAAVIRVLVPAGEANMALEELSDYLAHPGPWSAEALSRDPRLAPLRSDARFRALLR